MNSKKLLSRRPRFSPAELGFLAKLRNSHTLERQRFLDDMDFRQFSETTKKEYLNQVLRLTAFFRQSPLTLSDEQLRDYFSYLIKRNYSRSSLGVAHAALTFLYNFSLQRNMPFLKLFRNSRCSPLPIVLSHKKVKEILHRVSDERHRACLTLIYSCGLRISEAVKIEVKDIDSERGLIHIRNGKGNKERFVPLPDRTLQILRTMWKSHRHQKWIFPAYYGSLKFIPKRYGVKDWPVSAYTISNHFKAAARASGYKEDVRVHMLRHSYATTLLEEGIPIFTLKSHLGHSDIKSTLIYTHCTNKIRRAGMTSIENIMADL